MNGTESEKEVVIAKLIPATQGALWRAWTEASIVSRWWGPNGVSIPECTIEPNIGGAYNLTMLAGPELGPMAGARWPMTGIVQEVVPPHRLVFTNNALGSNGEVLLMGTTIVELQDEGAAGTLQTVVARAHGTGEQVAQMLAGMEAGWNQQIEKLIALVSAPLA